MPREGGESVDSYALGIDIGTTYTAAAIARRARDERPDCESLELGTRRAAVPTVVFLGDDGIVRLTVTCEGQKVLAAASAVLRG